MNSKKEKQNVFDIWNEEKQKIDQKEIKEFYVNQREIWFIKMGKNIGFEEDGKEEFLRPVLVLKKVGNVFLTVAMTSKGKSNHYFYHKMEEIELQNPKYLNSSFLILSQVKTIDKKRFVENVGIVSEKEFLEIQKKLKKMLF